MSYADEVLQRLAYRADGMAVYGPRVVWTAWNVTPGHYPYPVGSWTGWTEVSGSVEYARRQATIRLVMLRNAWPEDKFELREETRP